MSNFEQSNFELSNFELSKFGLIPPPLGVPSMHFDVLSFRSYTLCVGQCRNFGKCMEVIVKLGKTNTMTNTWGKTETFFLPLSQPPLCSAVATGWSLKTVDCNFFLTDPKNSKSAKTQWFSESLYREVLVFWCFKIVRCVNFASRSFSNIEHLLHHTGPDHSYTTLYAFKP